MPRDRLAGCQVAKSDDDALLGAVVYIYTGVSGALSSMGHSLRLRCKDFKFHYKPENDDSGEVKNVGTGEPRIVEAVFDANSIAVDCLIDKLDTKNMLPPEKQLFKEKENKAIEERIVGRYVLDVPTHSQWIKFRVDEQTPETVEGILSLHGRTGLVRCKRKDTETHFVAECPLIHSTFGMEPYGLGTKWFSVAPQVDVEVRIPKTVAKESRGGGSQ